MTFREYLESYDEPLREDFDIQDYTKAELAKHKESFIKFIEDIIKKVYDAKMAGLSSDYLTIYASLAYEQLENLEKISPKDAKKLRDKYEKMFKQADIDKKKRKKNPFNISKKMMKEWNDKLKTSKKPEEE